VSADLMFERELDNAPYIGMVAVTTYPLIEGLDLQPDNTKTSSQPPIKASSHLSFADETQEGEYHAALATLNELLDNPLPVFTKQLATTKLRPLWMTVVGTGGYWPVRILDRGGDTPTPTTLTGADLLGAWFVLLILTSGIAALQTGVLLTASPFAPRFR